MMVTVNHLMAQELDSRRLERDLRIAEDVVGSLIKSEAEEGEFFSAKVSARYSAGFGLILDLKRTSYFSSQNFNSNFDFHWEMNDEAWELKLEEIQAQAERIAAEVEGYVRDAEVIAREQELVQREHEREMREHEREMRELEREMHEKEREVQREEYRREREQYKREGQEMPELPEIPELPEPAESPEVNVVVESFPDPDESGVLVFRTRNVATSKNESEYEDLFFRVVHVYLSDYAGLIGQLPDDEKIMLITELRPTEEDESGYKLSAYALVKDVKDKTAGKLTAEKFREKIVFDYAEISNEKPADLELLASIFQRLYKSDLATTYYTPNRITYEKMDHYGVVYQMRVFSSISYGSDNYKIVTQGKSGLTEKERDKVVQEMYPQFEQELKENMLDYGKTIKSLSGNESLVVKVKLTKCEDCGIPESIEVSVSQEVLQAYNDGKMKRETALSKITISKS